MTTSPDPKFTCAGEPEAIATNSSFRSKGQRNRLAVLEAMVPGEWVAASALGDKTGLLTDTVREQLRRLIEDELVDDMSDGWIRRYVRFP